MSRIGNQVLTIPNGVEFKNENNVITVKGPKGELTRAFSTAFEIKVENNEITVINNATDKKLRALHGTTTALIKNMLTGVHEGFKKELELNGVGYRAAVKGKVVNLQVGLSHEVNMEIPQGITVEAPSNTELIISGFDKQVVGEFAANIRKIRKPEPYKGKGIKYKDEIILRKEGKRAGS
ncbi:MAG: 50S ribosomal protein L6 [Mycoplasmatales bacterium]